MNPSITFRIFRRLHIISDEERYGRISILGIIGHTCSTIGKLLLYKYCYSSFLLEPLNFKMLRPLFWKWMGCTVGYNVKIGHSVVLDYGNADLIELGN